MSRLRRIAGVDRVFFVTTNLLPAVPNLADPERDIVLQALDTARKRCGFLLLGYVIMPNHAHCVLSTETVPLPEIMHTWKTTSAYAIREIRGHGRLWQKRYFDFICRRRRDVGRKLEYIHANPVTAGFVRRPDAWRWSSAAYYLRSASCLIDPDRVDLSGDPDELLWPAPWRHP